MAHLPLEPPMSKLIYFGHIFNILNEAIIMGKYIGIYDMHSFTIVVNTIFESEFL